MSLNTLKDLLSHQLRDLYNADKQYLDILPAMCSSASDEDLVKQLHQISRDVRDGASKLVEACGLLGIPAAGVTCEAMRGLVREANENVVEQGDPFVVDAALIANAQRIAHYQIAGFGTARQFARVLDCGAVADILDTRAEMAGNHDKALTKVATGGWFSRGVNQFAEAGR
ncbi:ferritin-like domain-containing protein [Opitutales bacterium ASA1]|jgi:ferritin-like metal-binding protein YciE|uniref:DUF892 family protein n=1 Tax=Congregicoccus parvus TaxID=3081749 RepID=UPI002B2F95F6|nr:ferritin-like domain-containing protein [Opitutales bacterium ASA1]